MNGIKKASIVLGVLSLIYVCKFINNKFKESKNKQEDKVNPNCDSLCSKCACAEMCGCRKDVTSQDVPKDAVDDVEAIYQDILKDKKEFDNKKSVKDAVDDVEDIAKILDNEKNEKSQIEVDISNVEYHQAEVKSIITADKREQEDEGTLVNTFSHQDSTPFGEAEESVVFDENDGGMVFGEDDDIENGENEYEEVDMNIDKLQLK